MPEDGEREGGWSSLPDLLIWMIKDKVDIFDLRFAAVCRDWWSASISYPKWLRTVGDGLPSIWEDRASYSGSSRDFISVTREDKFSIDLPEFRDTSVLSSKCGWIFLRRLNYDKSKKVYHVQGTPDSLFLINLFTREEVKLPDGQGAPIGYAGSFSIREGYPRCVVYLVIGKDSRVTIGTAYPGDEVCTEHTYLRQRRPCFVDVLI